jgi:internalin A
MELSQLERLDISDNEISDLRPLIGLPALAKLDASDNQIAETTSAGSVEHLTELDLSGNPIRDFSGLGRLALLTALDLRSTSITDSDLRELYELKSISTIDLRDNSGLSDIAIGALKSALPGCSIATSELVYEIDFSGHSVRSDEKTLSFPSAGITDLSGISRMTCLEELNLSGNGIMSLFPFEVTASKATIRRLNLADNEIRDVLSLYALSALEELDLSGNQIQTVASLRKLTTLKKLNITGNPVSEEEVNSMREWLPECDILF